MQFHSLTDWGRDCVLTVDQHVHVGCNECRANQCRTIYTALSAAGPRAQGSAAVTDVYIWVCVFRLAWFVFVLVCVCVCEHIMRILMPRSNIDDLMYLEWKLMSACHHGSMPVIGLRYLWCVCVMAVRLIWGEGTEVRDQRGREVRDWKRKEEKSRDEEGARVKGEGEDKSSSRAEGTVFVFTTSICRSHCHSDYLTARLLSIDAFIWLLLVHTADTGKRICLLTRVWKHLTGNVEIPQLWMYVATELAE